MSENELIEKIAIKVASFAFNQSYETLTESQRNVGRDIADQIHKEYMTYFQQRLSNLEVLGDEERDNCTPTDEELEAYLAEPDDEVAAKLRATDPKAFRVIGRCLLYGRNIAQAQLSDIKRQLEEKME